MKPTLTFDEAYNTLEHLVQQIENEAVPLDVLAEKVKEAKALIAFCEGKLRGIETEIEGIGQ